jgi:hypothetical protein
MAHFDLSLYETVAQRLERWWTAFPHGRSSQLFTTTTDQQ